jgi:hypothetical protein
MSNISFNITAEALAANTSTDYSPVPAGSYNATIFDIKSETVKSGPNEGKPRFNIQFRISEGQHENRRVFGLVALYVAGDFWKTQSFFSALGYDLKSGKFEVPEINELLGKPIGVRVKIGKDQNGEDRNEIAGFDKPAKGSVADLLAETLGAKPVSDEDLWA